MAAGEKKTNRLMAYGMADVLAGEVYGGILDVETGVSAAGTIITDATDITRSVCIVSTCGSGAGVQLPTGTKVGQMFIVKNGGANAGVLYPPSATGTINGGSAGAGITFTNAKTYILVNLDGTDWLSVQLD